MKSTLPNIPIARRAERPFPEKEIFWGGQDGGQTFFPTLASVYERKFSIDPIPMKKFVQAVSSSQDRVWVVDEYFLMPDRGRPIERIEKILEWLPLWLAASDIRFLTKHHQEVDGECLKKIHQHAEMINNQATRRGKECRIEVRLHLTKSCDFIHDRFAIVDDELWHFGGSVGGLHSRVSAASRGWRAIDCDAERFFEEIWAAGE